MASILETIMRETFDAAAVPENPDANPNSLKNILLQETFGIAAQPEQAHPPTTLLVTATLLQEAGFLNPLSEVGKATEPEVPHSASFEVMRQVAEKSWLEAVGIATAFTVQDISKGAFQATEPDGPTVVERLGKWGKEKAKQVVTGVKTKHAATVSARTAAVQKVAAEAETKRQRDEALEFQREMNEARRTAADTEKDFADARKQSSEAEQQGATSAVVVAQSLQDIMDMFNSIKNGDAAPKKSQGSDYIDAEFTE